MISKPQQKVLSQNLNFQENSLSKTIYSHLFALNYWFLDNLRFCTKSGRSHSAMPDLASARAMLIEPRASEILFIQIHLINLITKELWVLGNSPIITNHPEYTSSTINSQVLSYFEIKFLYFS